MQGRRSPRGKIKQVKYIKNRLLFPISWLQKQDYCEYQIFLENIRGVKAEPTKEMSLGAEEHERLYTEFAEKAVPATLEQMVDQSKTTHLLSRELKVVDLEHGVYGYIDEVQMTPEHFLIIDDKPGIKVFTSNIHQVYGYCLAFQSTPCLDQRPIVAALRQRGTDQVFWHSPFDKSATEEITGIIAHLHDVLDGKLDFSATENPNKCRSCRLKPHCDRMTKQK